MQFYRERFENIWKVSWSQYLVWKNDINLLTLITEEGKLSTLYLHTICDSLFHFQRTTYVQRFAENEQESVWLNVK